MRMCKVCGLSEHEANIPSNRRICNPCRGRQIYAKHRVAILARVKANYDPEKSRAYKKRYLAANPDAPRKWQLRRLYGMTLEDYDMMLKSQGGVCRICYAASDRTLHVDHCHSTGRIRGLLCPECNTGLGKFRERPDLLQAAIDYLA